MSIAGFLSIKTITSKKSVKEMENCFFSFALLYWYAYQPIVLDPPYVYGAKLL